MKHFTMMNNAGRTVEVTTGFSWTSFILGTFITSIYRQDWKTLGITLASAFILFLVLLEVALDPLTVTLLPWVLKAGLSYYRNVWLTESYLKKGFKFIPDGDGKVKFEIDSFMGRTTNEVREWL